jgi:hypothetical protein
MTYRLLPLWIALLGGCGRPDPPLSLVVTSIGPDTHLALVTSPGLKLNARLEPALELSGGGLVRFYGTHLTPDSAYFDEPPVATLKGHHKRVHGTLRASVCDSDATVCRTVEVIL